MQLPLSEKSAEKSFQEISAVRMFFILLATLLLTETMVMLTFQYLLTGLSQTEENILDGILLVLFVFPSLHFTVFKPLARQIIRLQEADSALQESETTIKALLNSLSESAFLIDPQGIILTLNATAAGRFGDKREALLDSCIFDRFPAELAELWREKIGLVLEIEREVSFQEQREGRFYDITIFPVAIDKGRVIKLAIFAFDTTQYKVAEQQLTANASILQRSIEEIRVLSKMGEILQSCHNLEEAYSVAAKFAHQLFAEESGALYILNASRNNLEAISFWGSSPPTADNISPDDCWALRRGRLHIFRDIMTDMQCSHLQKDDGVEYICVPLMARNETLGMLHMQLPQAEEGETGRVYHESRIQHLESMADHMALAIANLRLREMLHNLSIKDPLTGIFNRRYMEASLEQELSRAERNNSQLSVIMLDIDHFKRFNDTFGHDAGDTLLRELGHFLANSIRNCDIPCRFGGEEFILILPDSSLDGATAKADQIRRGVKNLQLSHNSQPLGIITISMGIASFRDHGNDPSTLINAADEALYRAKHEGRDRVCLATTRQLRVIGGD